MELHGWKIALAGVENFFLFNAVLSILAFLIVLLIRGRCWFSDWHPQPRARFYAFALALPPLAAGWLVSASMLPAVWLDEANWRREHTPVHSLHLLNALTIPLDPMLGYVTFVFTLLAAGIAIGAAWRMYFRIGGVIEQLEIGAEPAAADRIAQVEATCQERGLAVGLVVSNYPFSFVWGYWRSKLIVSTGLLNALTPEELASVLEHEAAHHIRRDNLARMLLTVCRYLSPAFLLTGLLYRWWGEEVEMICDEVSARRTHSAVELAGALVRLKRLTLASIPFSETARQPIGSGFFGNGKDDFERRVTRVLALAEESTAVESCNLARSCLRTASLTLAVFALSLGALFVLSPLAVHEVIETIIQKV
jgi:Zn-dependent protease with chaperone function